MRTALAASLLASLWACSGTDEAPSLPDSGLALRDGGALTDAGPRDAGAPAPDGGPADAGFDQKTEAVIDIVQPMVDEGWYPSVSVAWLDDGEVHHFGFGEVGSSGEPPDGDTLYEIGSVTKTFTGTLLADMAVRGEVMVDATAQSVAWPTLTMPTFQATEIRLVDLATHFSGLPRLPTNLMPSNPADPYVDYTRDDLDAFLSGYMLPRAPGQAFEYSNLGVGLLGQLLAHTASTAYDQLLDQRVLAPIGMMDTGFVLDAEQQSRLAPGTDANGLPTANWDLGLFDPAGGLESSTNDMMLYAQAYLDRTTLGAAMDLATTAQAAIDPNVSIGLNWLLVNGGELVLHDGATGGYNAMFVLVPDEARAVVVLANGTSYLTNTIGFAIVEAVRGRAYQRPDPMPTVAVDAAILDANAGIYALAGNAAVQAVITRDGASLWIQLTDQPAFRLFATSDRVYYVRVAAASVAFDAPDGQGDVAGFTLRQEGQNARFVRVP